MSNSRAILFLIVHGVQYGRLSTAYASDFIDRLEQLIPSSTPIYVRSVNWSRFIEARQQETYERLKVNHRFWLRPVLRLMAYLLTDTWWYLLNRLGKDKSDLEERTEQLVRHEIEVFLKEHPDGLVVLGGHSWGSQIALKLCYDTLKIHGLITWGTVTYYLSGAFDDWGKPPPVKFWLNFFNPADPVATTMLENDNFKNFVTVVPINNWLKLTPILAHTNYWKSNKMIETIAEVLQKQ